MADVGASLSRKLITLTLPNGGEYENRTRLIFLFAREVSTPCTPIPHKILFERFKWSKSIPVHNTTGDYFRFIFTRFQMTKPHISIAVGGSLSPNPSSRALPQQV